MSLKFRKIKLMHNIISWLFTLIKHAKLGINSSNYSSTQKLNITKTKTKYNMWIVKQSNIIKSLQTYFYPGTGISPLTLFILKILIKKRTQFHQLYLQSSHHSKFKHNYTTPSIIPSPNSLHDTKYICNQFPTLYEQALLETLNFPIFSNNRNNRRNRWDQKSNISIIYT